MDTIKMSQALEQRENPSDTVEVVNLKDIAAIIIDRLATIIDGL